MSISDILEYDSSTLTYKRLNIFFDTQYNQKQNKYASFFTYKLDNIFIEKTELSNKLSYDNF